MNPTIAYASRDGVLSYNAAFADLPEATQNKIIASGVNHILGNEVASRFAAWKEKNATADDASQGTARTSIFNDFVEKMKAGLLGTRIGGPKADPVETEMDNIARDELLTVLEANGVKIARKDATDELSLEINGVTTTLGDLIENRLVKHAERIRKAAEGTVKAKEKARLAKAKAKVEATERAKSEGGLAALLD